MYVCVIYLIAFKQIQQQDFLQKRAREREKGKIRSITTIMSPSTEEKKKKQTTRLFLIYFRPKFVYKKREREREFNSTHHL